jgi:Ca2+-binding EF-hand superfamily protein
MFLVKIPPNFPATEETQMVLNARFLQPLIDKTVPAEASAATSSKKTNASHNRGSARTAMDSLSAQIRKCMKAKKQESIMAVFVTDDGKTTKSVFTAGLAKLGIEMSIDEIELVWPIFDRKDHGTIDVDELISQIQYDKAPRTTCDTRSFAKIQALKNKTATHITRMQRTERIMDKTEYSQELNLLIAKLKDGISKICKSRGITATDLFADWDDDSSGELDKNEFHAAFNDNGLRLRLAEMDMLWPTMDLDDNTTVGPDEWVKFLQNTDWSFKHTQDKYVNKTRRKRRETRKSKPSVCTANETSRKEAKGVKQRKPKGEATNRIKRTNEARQHRHDDEHGAAVGIVEGSRRTQTRLYGSKTKTRSREVQQLAAARSTPPPGRKHTHGVAALPQPRRLYASKNGEQQDARGGIIVSGSLARLRSEANAQVLVGIGSGIASRWSPLQMGGSGSIKKTRRAHGGQHNQRHRQREETVVEDEAHLHRMHELQQMQERLSQDNVQFEARQKRLKELQGIKPRVVQFSAAG